MNIKHYLDSTYLKTAAQANLSEQENTEVVKNCIQEAIDYDFKLIIVVLPITCNIYIFYNNQNYI